MTLEKSKIIKISATHTSFHESISTILAFSQFFGMISVKNVTNSDERLLKFSWFSIRTIYAITFLVLGSTESAFAIRRVFRLGFNIHFAEGLFFFTMSMIRAILIFKVTLNWKDIIQYWRKAESVFLHPPYFEKGWKLKSKCRCIFIFLIVQFVFPHVFFLVASGYDNYVNLKTCHMLDDTDFWHNYMQIYRPHLLYHIPYTPYLLPLYEWINMLQAFVVSFADTLIILFATGITTRLNQFNDLLEYMMKQKEYYHWRKMRHDYVKIVNLIRFTDSHIHILSFICIGHNSLQFAFRVFKAFKPNRFNLLSHIHFYFVLIILAIQLIATLFTCANMNRSALKPLETLRNIPSKYWSIDFKILQHLIEIENKRLAFTVVKSSFITRSMILSLFGTIATFQIILLDQVQPERETICTFVND
ncbi:hypothetical protein PVAND_011578 [Polypedilum vanderplanki]|uniref:Gustatory receptor n=1 Tax=Polypedilum vanderplanki TaxID=319348 RepID=A0A9J6CJP0_POLVA|nr:hypothetical protein PVAND_011578 [Polypedilum vanderplanki]